MRTLFLLSAHNTQELNPILRTIQCHHPDVIILSPDPELIRAQPLHHAKGLLGHTLNSIVLDARRGFPLDYFLCAANTIQKNGAFFLIWSPSSYDEQSRRFHTTQIPTDHFQDFLSKGLLQYGRPFSPNNYVCHLSTSSDQQPLNGEQQEILSALNAHQQGVMTLFAPRGTGKSFVVAEFLRNMKDQYIITAPNQTALKSYANLQLNFMAPDYLFLNHTKLHQAWLIIEESAQMPIPHLEKLSRLANKVLLISSIENYEGTGKGLEKKLADIIPIRQSLTLSERHRFESHDPLSQFCDYISLNHDDQSREKHKLTDGYALYDENNLCTFQQNSTLVTKFYQLMNEHHYQTNAQDIRRLFDSPDQVFVTHIRNHQLIGGIWGIQEGLLSQELAQDVFNGYRRPQGNLVVQSLSAHSYYPELMMLKSLRISRIAVDIHHRKIGIANNMIQQVVHQSKQQGYDFISTSFGLTKELLQFWQQCGFTWVHLGSHRDKTTGLHAAIMILPISKWMEEKVAHMQQKWQNDAYYLQRAPFVHPNIHELLAGEAVQEPVNDHDEKILQAYFAHKKPKEAVFSALQRKCSRLNNN